LTPARWQETYAPSQFGIPNRTERPMFGSEILEVAIGVAFVGSRWFTWRHRPRTHVGREYTLFMLFSVLAAGIQLACLLVARHALGLTSPLADNISANVVGMALATLFRFWTFRTFVFPR